MIHNNRVNSLQWWFTVTVQVVLLWKRSTIHSVACKENPRLERDEVSFYQTYSNSVCFPLLLDLTEPLQCWVRIVFNRRWKASRHITKF